MAFRRDQNNRRPGSDRIFVPEPAVGVVNDSVSDIVSTDGFPDPIGVALVGKFRTVNTDDDESVTESLLEIVEYGYEMKAIDAAVRPEIQKH